MIPQKIYRYEEIASALRKRIAAGEYAPMERLPSERTLTGEFKVQRDTIRRALEVLESERRIFRDTTRGTFVAPTTGSAAAARGGGGGPEPRYAVPGGAGIGSRAADAPRRVTNAATRCVLLGVRRADTSTAPAAVMRGLAQVLGEQGYPVLWHDAHAKSDGDPRTASDSLVPPLELLMARSVVGAVLWPEMPAPVARLRALRDAMPLVLVDRRVPGFESDFVGFDDCAGGRAVTEHLLGLGHRRIGFLSGEPEATTVQERQRGYVSALEAAGIAVQPNWVMHQQGGTQLIPPAVLDAYIASGGAPLTAIVCANDLIAAHLIGHARSSGMRVPEDVAVTGFGNLLPGVLDAFGVTTVAQPFEKVGCIAGDILLSRLGRRGASGAIREVELPMDLIVRETCGARLK